MPKVLIVSGGWDGHHPFEVAQSLDSRLTQDGFEVVHADNLDAFAFSADYDVVIPNWTMGEIDYDQVKPLIDAVEGGVGLAGLHGGMGDAFRASSEYQFVTGGQFVAHPGNSRPYTVHFLPGFELTAGLADYEVTTEQYYMHVDPAIRVLATCTFADFDNTIMPLAWTKTWGAGRVFYCSLGHDPSVVNIELMARGVRWAADKTSKVHGASFKNLYK